MLSLKFTKPLDFRAHLRVIYHCKPFLEMMLQDVLGINRETQYIIMIFLELHKNEKKTMLHYP